MIGFLFAFLAVFTLSPNKASVYDISNENWHLQSEAYMTVKDGKKLSSRKFDDYDWMKISFPSTVVAAFVEAGECAEPVAGEEDFLAIPHHLVRGYFWYRSEFAVPAQAIKEHTFLNLSGVNGEAQVWLNGKFVGNVPDSLHRARFDVTGIVKGKNALAVKVKADSDKAGLCSEVYFSFTGDVSLGEPFVITTLNLPDTTEARIKVGAEVTNHGKSRKRVVLSGKYGWMPFEVTRYLNPGQSEVFSTTLEMENPRLWWSNALGEQHLYDVEMKLYAGHDESDKTFFRSAVRDISVEGDSLFVNGIYAPLRGTCAPDGLDRFDRVSSRELRAIARYCKDLNFNVFATTEEDARRLSSCADEYGFVLLDSNSAPALDFDYGELSVSREPASDFYACKRANESVHVQYVDGKVEVVNRTLHDLNGVKVGAQWFDINGRSLSEQVTMINVKSGSVSQVFAFEKPCEGVGYLELAIYLGEDLLSENFHIEGSVPEDYPKATLRVGGEVNSTQDGWSITYLIENLGDVPALMLCARVDNPDGEAVLPVFWSDNYISLLPGEKKVLTAEVDKADCPHIPQVSITGFNL